VRALEIRKGGGEDESDRKRSTTHLRPTFACGPDIPATGYAPYPTHGKES
jgi:hypothetical protein